VKWRATHEITIERGDGSRVAIPVMYQQGWLYQRTDSVDKPPIWRMVDGRLGFRPTRLGQPAAPTNATIRQLGRGSHPRRGKPATARLTVHLTPEEHAAVTAAAERAGRKASAWAAPILIAAAKP